MCTTVERTYGWLSSRSHPRLIYFMGWWSARFGIARSTTDLRPTITIAQIFFLLEKGTVCIFRTSSVQSRKVPIVFASVPNASWFRSFTFGLSAKHSSDVAGCWSPLLPNLTICGLIAAAQA